MFAGCYHTAGLYVVTMMLLEMAPDVLRLVTVTVSSCAALTLLRRVSWKRSQSRHTHALPHLVSIAHTHMHAHKNTNCRSADLGTHFQVSAEILNAADQCVLPNHVSGDQMSVKESTFMMEMDRFDCCSNTLWL